MIPPPIEFHFQRGQQRLGPYSLTQVREFVTSGQLVATDLAWHSGMTAWSPLSDALAPHGIVVAPAAKSAGSSSGLEWVIPINRSGLSIAAGYLGLFSVLVFPAPLALLLGILALRDLRRNPSKGGRGRAWFGATMGALGSVLLVIFLVATLARG